MRFIAQASLLPYLETAWKCDSLLEQQAQLAQIATKAGTDPERVVANLVARYLDEEARFLAAVENGIAAAERGEFIEEEEMDAPS